MRKPSEPDRLYHQSGLGALKWENIPDPAREVMVELIARQYTDWFGLVSAGDESHAATAQSGSASILNAPSPAICWPSYLHAAGSRAERLRGADVRCVDHNQPLLPAVRHGVAGRAQRQLAAPYA